MVYDFVFSVSRIHNVCRDCKNGAGSVSCDFVKAKFAEFRIEVDKLVDGVATGEVEMESVAGWMNHATAKNVLKNDELLSTAPFICKQLQIQFRI